MGADDQQPDDESDETGDPPQVTTPILSNPSRDATEAVTWGVRVAAAWTWRLVAIGVGLYILSRVFLRVELVAFSLILALFLTAVLHPLENRLRSLLNRKSASAAITLLVGIAVLAGIGVFVSWQISTHASQLGDQVNDFVAKAKTWLQNGPLHVKSADFDKLQKNITDTIKSHQGQLVTGAIETVQTVVETLGALLLILLSTFFMLRDGDLIWGWTLRFFPSQAHDRLDLAGRVGWRTLGGYMRGQLLIALFHGTSVFVVLLVLRVPLAAALAVLIFLGAFIPLVGLTVTGALCTAVALLEHGYTAAIVVAVAIVVLVQLEAHLLQPLVMSRSVEVHPLAIAVAVITGTVLTGIVGALLAVPFVAFLNSTAHALRESATEPVAAFPVVHRDGVGGEHADPVIEEKQRMDADAAADHADEHGDERGTTVS